MHFLTTTTTKNKRAGRGAKHVSPYLATTYEQYYYSLKFALDNDDNYSILEGKEVTLVSAVYKTLVIDCPHCGTESVVQVDTVGYEKWKNKEGYLKNLCPDLTKIEREIIISGTCDACWQALWQ